MGTSGLLDFYKRFRKRGPARHKLSRLVNVDLTDMADLNEDFRGIYTPANDMGKNPIGVTSQFLENAAEYHRKNIDLEEYRHLLEAAFQTIGYVNPSPIIMDLGCGSGNTAIPALELFDSSSVIAVDISPNLLAILRDFIYPNDSWKSRCLLLCMDATYNYFKENSFDLIIGSSILHHLPYPEKAFETVYSSLKKGGHAIFFEPFETGNSILQMAYRSILKEEENHEGMETAVHHLLNAMVIDLSTRAHLTEDLMPQLDDKWLFTRSYFEEITREYGFRRLRVLPIGDISKPFSKQTEVTLRRGISAPPEALPEWAWDILRYYDGIFSETLKKEMIIEGMIILTK